MSSTSIAWQYCQKKVSAGEEVAVCNICDANIKCKDSSTTGIIRHLKRKHDIDCMNLKQQQNNNKKSCMTSSHDQPTLKGFVDSKLPYDKSSNKRKVNSLNYKVAKMIFLDLQPLSLVDDAGFRELMKEADSRYTLPCRKTVRNAILPELYARCSQKLKDTIQSYKTEYGEFALFSITTDAWTSSANQSYITYTLHIIRNFSIKTFNLCTVEVSERHTAHNLRAHLFHTLQDWGIAPVMDGGDNQSSQEDSNDCHQMMNLGMICTLLQN